MTVRWPTPNPLLSRGILLEAAALLACCCLLAHGRRLAASPPSSLGWAVLLAGNSQLMTGSNDGGEMYYVVVPNTLLPGQVLTPPGGTPLPSMEACAVACLHIDKCYIFNWCPVEAKNGCPADPTGTSTLPPKSCQLLWQSAAEQGTGVVVYGQGAGVPSVAGAPLLVGNVTLPGYQSLLGRSFLNQYNEECPNSLRKGQCRLPGTLEALSQHCSADSRCEAFTWRPKGIEEYTGSVGILKFTGSDAGSASQQPGLDLSVSNVNPGSIVFVKDSVRLFTGDASSSPTTSQPPAGGILSAGEAHVAPTPVGNTNASSIIVPSALLPGPLVVPGQGNLQPTLQSCAAACFRTDKCTVFNWCPSSGSDCPVDLTGGEPLPPGGCELRYQATTLEGNSIILLLQADSVTTMAGAPLRAPANASLTAPGYDTLPGQLLLGHYQLSCPGSIRNDSCRLVGDAANISAACNAHPDCQAFELSPQGRDAVNVSVGTLKGNPGRKGAIDLNKSNWNPRAYLLVRQGVQVTPAGPVPGEDLAPGSQDSGNSSSGSGLSGGAIAGIVVGASAAALLAAAAAVAVSRRRRRRAREQHQPLRALRTSSREDSAGGFQLAGRHGPASAEDEPAVLHSPSAGPRSSPRRRVGGSPLSAGASAAASFLTGPSALTGSATLPAPAAAAAAARAAGGAGKEGGLPGASAAARRSTVVLGGAAGGLSSPSSDKESSYSHAVTDDSTAGAASVPAWALEALRSSFPDWESALVSESEIDFLPGPDGKPISLGAGSFGTVYKVLLGRHTQCAAKMVEWEGRDHMKMEFVQECVMLLRLRHPNIVAFMGACVTETRGILLMEFCPGRDLDAAMNTRSRANGTRLFDWYGRGHRVARDVASGLAYLHHSRVLHLDIKPHNVLLGRDGTAKLGDVGFARLMSRTHLSIDGRFGTFDWCAPEVLMGRGATDKSDIYSFGVVLWEVCSGTRPRRGQMPPLRTPDQCPPQVAALQLACVSEVPEERPSAAQILEALTQLPAPRLSSASEPPISPPRAEPATPPQAPLSRGPSQTLRSVAAPLWGALAQTVSLPPHGLLPLAATVLGAAAGSPGTPRRKGSAPATAPLVPALLADGATGEPPKQAGSEQLGAEAGTGGALSSYDSPFAVTAISGDTASAAASGSQPWNASPFTAAACYGESSGAHALSGGSPRAARASCPSMKAGSLGGSAATAADSLPNSSPFEAVQGHSSPFADAAERPPLRAGPGAGQAPSSGFASPFSAASGEPTWQPEGADVIPSSHSSPLATAASQHGPSRAGVQVPQQADSQGKGPGTAGSLWRVRTVSGSMPSPFAAQATSDPAAAGATFAAQQSEVGPSHATAARQSSAPFFEGFPASSAASSAGMHRAASSGFVSLAAAGRASQRPKGLPMPTGLPPRAGSRGAVLLRPGLEASSPSRSRSRLAMQRSSSAPLQGSDIGAAAASAAGAAGAATAAAVTVDPSMPSLGLGSPRAGGDPGALLTSGSSTLGGSVGESDAPQRSEKSFAATGGADAQGCEEGSGSIVRPSLETAT